MLIETPLPRVCFFLPYLHHITHQNAQRFDKAIQYAASSSSGIRDFDRRAPSHCAAHDTIHNGSPLRHGDLAVIVNSTLYTSCTAFQTSNLPCGSDTPYSISCYPHVSAVSDIDDGYFYSPGLHCPAHWETVLTVTSGQGGGTSMLSAITMDTLLSDETVAI